MNKIAVHDFDEKYKDLKEFLEFDFLFKEAQVKGEIFNSDFAMLLQSNLKIKELKFENNQFLRNKDVVLNINLLKQNKIYSFKDATVAIEKLKLNLTGTFDHENIDLKAKGAELDIQFFYHYCLKSK